MAQSLAKIYLHTIFCTKNRREFIEPEIEIELYKYIAGILSKKHRLSGYQNRRNVRSYSHFKYFITHNNYQQNGYGVFSVSESKVNTVKTYIENQREHHKKKSFKEEFKAFLKEYNIEYNERYIWD